MNNIFYPYGERLPHIKKSKLEYPIDISTAKDHLRIDYDDDDTQIQRLIKASTQAAENYIQSDIAVTSNTLKQYDFIGNTYMVKQANLIDDVSIKAKDKNDNPLVIKESEKNYNSFYIEFKESLDVDPLILDFSTGFYPDECDELVKQAILVKLEDLYAVERSSYKSKDYNYNKAFQNLLNEYKSIYF